MKKKKKNGDAVLEVSRGKRREKQEKFFVSFSGIQVNVVTLFILASTFLITGLIKYTEVIGLNQTRQWLSTLILSIMFFTISVFFTLLSGIFYPLKFKRWADIFSFISFLLGAAVFFLSLVMILLLLRQ